MYYQQNRLRAQFKNVDPTLTDQAAARSTDINVIVGQFRIGGQAIGTSGQVLPIQDLTGLPNGLREMMEAARTIGSVRERLPLQLRRLPLEQLLALTPQQLTNILNPPADPPAKPQGEK